MMKPFKYKILTLLCISIFLMGADCTNRIMNYKISPFIANYAQIDEIGLYIVPTRTEYPLGIGIHIERPRYNKIFSYFDKKEERQQYEKYNKINNDVGNCNIRFSSNSSWKNYLRLFFVESIDQIEITCDQDYDAQHPKGSSLNDCFTIVGLSPLKFIQSQYSNTYNWEADQICPKLIKDHMLDERPAFNGARHAIHPVIIPLKDLEPGDLELCGGFIDQYEDLHSLLTFDIKPAIPGVYTFRAKITLSDGRVFEDWVDYDLSVLTNSEPQ